MLPIPNWNNVGINFQPQQQFIPPQFIQPNPQLLGYPQFPQQFQQQNPMQLMQPQQLFFPQLFPQPNFQYPFPVQQQPYFNNNNNQKKFPNQNKPKFQNHQNSQQKVQQNPQSLSANEGPESESIKYNSAFEITKKPVEVPIVGGFVKENETVMSESAKLYIEMRKKKFPSKEKAQQEKLDREMRQSRGELVDLPNFEVPKPKKQKQKKSRNSKNKRKNMNEEGDSILKQLFRKTVISENIGILQSIRYIVSNNFFFKEGDPLQVKPSKIPKTLSMHNNLDMELI
jgi:hypothetical protein